MRRCLAVSLTLALAVPTPAWALRPSGVEAPEVRAQLQAGLEESARSRSDATKTWAEWHRGTREELPVPLVHRTVGPALNVSLGYYTLTLSSKRFQPGDTVTAVAFPAPRAERKQADAIVGVWKEDSIFAGAQVGRLALYGTSRPTDIYYVRRQGGKASYTNRRWVVTASDRFQFKRLTGLDYTSMPSRFKEVRHTSLKDLLDTLRLVRLEVQQLRDAGRVTWKLFEPALANIPEGIRRRAAKLDDAAYAARLLTRWKIASPIRHVSPTELARRLRAFEQASIVPGKRDHWLLGAAKSAQFDEAFERLRRAHVLLRRLGADPKLRDRLLHASASRHHLRSPGGFLQRVWDLWIPMQAAGVRLDAGEIEYLFTAREEPRDRLRWLRRLGDQKVPRLMQRFRLASRLVERQTRLARGIVDAREVRDALAFVEGRVPEYLETVRVMDSTIREVSPQTQEELRRILVGLHETDDEWFRRMKKWAMLLLTGLDNGTPSPVSKAGAEEARTVAAEALLAVSLQEARYLTQFEQYYQ